MIYATVNRSSIDVVVGEQESERLGFIAMAIIHARTGEVALRRHGHVVMQYGDPNSTCTIRLVQPLMTCRFMAVGT